MMSRCAVALASGGVVGGVAADWIVAQDGSGDSKTVQAALDAVPKGNTKPFVIFIKPGAYHEKLTVRDDQPFVHFVGSPSGEPVLTYDDYANKLGPNGKGMGTFATQ